MDITTPATYNIKKSINNNNFSCTKEKEVCVLNKWRICYVNDEYSFMPQHLSRKKRYDIPLKDIEIFMLNRDIDVINAIELLDERTPIIESYTLSMMAIEKFSSWFLGKKDHSQDLIQQKLDNLFMLLIKSQCPLNFVSVCIKHLCELSVGNILYRSLSYFLDKAIEAKNIDLSQFFAFKISGLEVTEKDRFMLPERDRYQYYYDNSKFIFYVIKNKFDHKNEILKFILILIIKILCNSQLNTPANEDVIDCLKKDVLSIFAMLHEYEPNILKSILKHLQIITTIKQSSLKPIGEDKINLCKIACNSLFKTINNNNIYQIEEKLFQIDEIIPFHTMKIIFQELYRAELADINYDEINDDIDDFISMAQINIK